MTALSWTDERIEELKQLWGEGLSAQDIGKKLGVTKNAVIGKAHRLGLPPRPSPIRRARPATATKARRKTSPTSVGLRATGHTCVWPIGDPAEDDFRFCDAPSMPHKPYCQKHYDLAYIQPRPRSARAS